MNKYTRKCGKCSKIMTYLTKNAFSLSKSKAKIAICPVCSSKKTNYKDKLDKPMFRKCPKCNKDVKYINMKSYKYSERKKSLCSSCCLIDRKTIKSIGFDKFAKTVSRCHSMFEVCNVLSCSLHLVKKFITQNNIDCSHFSTKNLRTKSYKDLSGTMYANIERRHKKYTGRVISKKYMYDLFVKTGGICPYTGLTISIYTFYGNVATASLDRINIDKGYIKGNVQWVHKDYNKSKMERTDQEHLELSKIHVAHTAGVSLEKLQNFLDKQPVS